MSWRVGAELFCEIWPIIDEKVTPGEFRNEFVRDLVDYFLQCDMDPTDVAGIHPDIDKALRSLGELADADE
jgi:hypothetical protein